MALTWKENLLISMYDSDRSLKIDGKLRLHLVDKSQISKNVSVMDYKTR